MKAIDVQFLRLLINDTNEGGKSKKMQNASLYRALLFSYKSTEVQGPRSTKSGGAM